MGIDAYGRLKRAAKDLVRKARLADSFRFHDRKQDAETLVIILAGYKKPLWPFVFPRLERAIPRGADVCVMSAGVFNAELEALCERNEWSYLHNKTNDVSLIQNIAISLHPSSKMVVKIDEDMFLTADTIIDCLAYYKAVKDRGVVSPGFVAPMININGVCYRPLLSQLGLLEEYELAFGPARLASVGIPVTDDAKAARWMWRMTAPLEETVKKLKPSAEPVFLAAIQFSIGMIVFEREFWDEIDFYPVNRRKLLMNISTLGADEEYLCRIALFKGRPGVICEHALAGHFSFHRQYAEMLRLLAEAPIF